MSTIDQLAHASTEALKDADASKARVASHFLRVQLPELFRLARLAVQRQDPAQAKTETIALIRKNRDHA